MRRDCPPRSMRRPEVRLREAARCLRACRQAHGAASSTALPPLFPDASALLRSASLPPLAARAGSAAKSAAGQGTRRLRVSAAACRLFLGQSRDDMEEMPMLRAAAWRHAVLLFLAEQL